MLRSAILAAALAICGCGVCGSASAGRCDLSGDWLANTRVGGGGSIPASTAETVRVAQAADGSFRVTDAKGGAVGSGRVLADRNVELRFSTAVVPAPAPPPPASCATEQKCNASHPGHVTKCPGGPVYYCCGICSGTYACRPTAG